MALVQRNDVIEQVATTAAGPSVPRLHSAKGSGSRFARNQLSCPIQFEPSLVPAHHCLWEDENERFFPVGPETARHDPEEFIEWTQPGSRVLAFQDSELLAKGEVF
jgi:hypothetical protein